MVRCLSRSLSAWAGMGVLTIVMSGMIPGVHLNAGEDAPGTTNRGRGLLGVRDAFVAELRAKAEQFPPYPEIWGYELPWGSANRRYAALHLYRMPNGDYVVTHTTGFDKVESRRVYSALFVFGGRSQQMSKDEYNAFARKNEQIPDGQTVTFRDGSSVARWGDCGGNCCSPYSLFLRKRDDQGMDVMRKAVVVLLDRAVSVSVGKYCEQNQTLSTGEILTRVVRVRPRLALLEDDSILVGDTEGNLVLRLDRNLNSRSGLLGRRVFLVDWHEVEEARVDSRTGRPRSDQETADALERMLDSRRMEAPR